MKIRTEFEALKLNVTADKALLESGILDLSRKNLRPIERFWTKYFPVRLTAYLTGSVTYLFNRLLCHDSPEEITTRSQSIIRYYTEPEQSVSDRELLTP